MTQLGPDTGLLRAGLGDVRSEIEMLVHPDRAAVILAATSNARSRSDDQTEPPRPKSVWLARAITSSMSE